MQATPQRTYTARSTAKRESILAAAESVFLRDGYLGTNMDEIAAVSRVSKQTVYKHFGSKEALFVAIVTSMTVQAGDGVHLDAPEIGDVRELRAYLSDYAFRQLRAVLTPRIMQVRRLVIGEVGRFPDLARALYSHGPQRALTAMTSMFERLADRGLLEVSDAGLAAEQFNWLVMSAPVNRAMLLGDAEIPSSAELRRHADQTAQFFLAAYGVSAPAA